MRIEEFFGFKPAEQAKEFLITINLVYYFSLLCMLPFHHTLLEKLVILFFHKNLILKKPVIPYQIRPGTQKFVGRIVVTRSVHTRYSMAGPGPDWGIKTRREFLNPSGHTVGTPILPIPIEKDCSFGNFFGYSRAFVANVFFKRLLSLFLMSEQEVVSFWRDYAESGYMCFDSYLRRDFQEPG